MNVADEFWTSGEAIEAEAEIESAVPIVLAGYGEDIAPESVDPVFARALAGLTEAEAESLGNALRKVGKWANDKKLGQLAGAVLPVAGAAVGTVYGGPLGATIGRTIGERAGQAIAGKPKPAGPVAAPAAAPRPTSFEPAGAVPTAGEPAIPEPAAAAAPVGPVGDGSPSAAKLLYLVQNPAFLSSLVSLALGLKGQPTVPVGSDDKPVPLGAFLNVANNLLAKTTEDAEALVGDGDAESLSYLRSETGCLACDPAVPSERAKALLDLLQREEESLVSLGAQYGESLEAEDWSEWGEDWPEWNEDWQEWSEDWGGIGRGLARMGRGQVVSVGGVECHSMR